MAEKEGVLQRLFYMQAAFADITILWQKRADPSKISHRWAFSVVCWERVLLNRVYYIVQACLKFSNSPSEPLVPELLVYSTMPRHLWAFSSEDPCCSSMAKIRGSKTDHGYMRPCLKSNLKKKKWLLVGVHTGAHIHYRLISIFLDISTKQWANTGYTISHHAI